MTSKPVAVSAPGKVLFAGGFLVLDRKHTGLVFGLDARIHTHVQQGSVEHNQFASPERKHQSIVVQSPQFRDAKWLYSVYPTERVQGEAFIIEQITNDERYTKSRNKFVEVTLQYVLTYLSHTSKDINRSIKVSIIADNDYYSQSASASPEKRHGFTDFGVSLNDAHKTGLGSSAALVTSLVSSLLAYYSGTTNLPQKTIHNLAQAAHCAAQGKVGSGFDVAAAVYGSCLYRRFSPEILEAVGEPSAPGFGEKLQLCVDDLNPEHKWDVEVLTNSVKIPDSLLLLMCDIDRGTETPSMVRKVLEWRKQKPKEADLIWKVLQRDIDVLCEKLRHLSESGGINMKSQGELTNIILEIRTLVQQMSQKSGVPIEPKVIGELLDDCTGLPGVVGGVAPGAGGYDAVALLIQNDAEVYRDLQSRLENWTSRNGSFNPDEMIGKVRLLKVRQDKEGIKLEDAARYGDWVQ